MKSKLRNNLQTGNGSVENIFLAYVDAINSGSSETILSFVEQYYAAPLVQQIPRNILLMLCMVDFYCSGGLGYNLHQVRQSHENAYVAVIYNRLTEAWLHLQFSISPPPVCKLIALPKIEPVAATAIGVTRTPWDDQVIIQRLEACLERVCQVDEFSGVVRVSKNDALLFDRAYGLANKSYEIPNHRHTKFNIASLGKMFTGIAVTQLIERGRLHPHDPVCKYLSEDWLKSAHSQGIQIQHLLTHTSGLGDYFKSLSAQLTPLVFRKIEDYKPLIVDSPPAFSPGTQWSYSNSGMLLLGVIVAQITGESYFDYVRNQVFLPAGMIHTDFFEKDQPVHDRATGYAKDFESVGARWLENPFTRVMKGSPSGGSFSTTEDMFNLASALRNHKLLNPQYTDIALSAKPELNSPFYGYGFFIHDGPIGRIASHGGDGVGISCQFKMYLDSGYTVIVLSNYGLPAADIVGDVIHQLLISHVAPVAAILE